MINVTGNGKTICPFYKNEGKNTIVCEAFTEDADNILKFAEKEQKREHQENFCFCRCYEGCPICQTAKEKYETETL